MLKIWQFAAAKLSTPMTAETRNGSDKKLSAHLWLEDERHVDEYGVILRDRKVVHPARATASMIKLPNLLVQSFVDVLYSAALIGIDQQHHGAVCTHMMGSGSSMPTPPHARP